MLKGIIATMITGSLIQNTEKVRKLSSQEFDNSFLSDSTIDQNIIKFREFDEGIFENIRDASGITKEMLFDSLNPDANKKSLLQVGEGEGNSGSFFFISHDKRFIIKIIQKDEKENIGKMLEMYFAHLRNNPDSLLLRIYSMFQIKVKRMASVYAILVPNVFFLEGQIQVHQII